MTKREAFWHMDVKNTRLCKSVLPCLKYVSSDFVVVNVELIKPVYQLLRSLVDNAETQAMTVPELGLCDDEMKLIWYSICPCTCQTSSFWRGTPILCVIHFLMRKASGSLPEDSASAAPEASESEPETYDEEVRGWGVQVQSKKFVSIIVSLHHMTA